MSVSDLKSLNQIFKIHGRDKRGRHLLHVNAKYFPVRFASVDAVKNYLEEKIFPVLSKRQFSILYFHTGVHRADNFPGLSALRSIYDAVPAAVKSNLESVYFVHPGIHARLFLATFGRLHFGAEIYGKVKYVNRVDKLWEHMRRNQVELPEFVVEYDEEIECRQMIDYGLESDHPRVLAAPSMDSPVAMYAMRGIS